MSYEDYGLTKPFEKHTVDELKSLLKNKNLSIKGKKSDLIATLKAGIEEERAKERQSRELKDLGPEKKRRKDDSPSRQSVSSDEGKKRTKKTKKGIHEPEKQDMELDTEKLQKETDAIQKETDAIQKKPTKVFLDIELKRRFKNPALEPKEPNDDPILTIANAESFFHGDTKQAYLQMLNRAQDALEGGAVIYYYAMLDLQSIIFWKIEFPNEGFKVSCLGIYPFGGLYKEDNLQPPSADTIPSLGFNILCSLISFRLAGQGQPSVELYNNDTEETKSFKIIRKLGKGKFSNVFAVLDSLDRICSLKIEPIQLSHQIKNEIFILPQLDDCVGVPKLLFYGTTKYLEHECVGIVTNFVGENSLSDLAKVNYLKDESIGKYASLCINILRSIHERGILYVDVKPDHFMFQDGQLFLVDYDSSQLLGSNESPYYITPKYCSFYYYLPFSQEESSDFQSLWFTLVSLCQLLPWNDNDNSKSIFFEKSTWLPQQREHLIGSSI